MKVVSTPRNRKVKNRAKSLDLNFPISRDTYNIAEPKLADAVMDRLTFYADKLEHKEG
jgi:hypothetical protein